MRRQITPSSPLLDKEYVLIFSTPFFLCISSHNYFFFSPRDTFCSTVQPTNLPSSTHIETKSMIKEGIVTILSILGLFFYLPCLDKCHKLDLRLKTFEVPFHQIVTKDLVTLEVDVVCYYRLENAPLFLTSVSTTSNTLQLLVQTTMKRILAHKAFLDILLERKSIGEEVKVALDAVSCKWGIQIEKAEIKDVKLPDDVKQSMAIEAEAQRQAKVKVIAAENEKVVSESLKLAAETLAGSPTAIQLRYLQTLQCMTSERPATFFLPLPFDLMNLNLTPKVQESSVASNQPKPNSVDEQGKKKDSPML